MKGALFGSLVADALTLGTHYEYDAERIASFYGKLDRYYAPGERTGGETHGVGWGARNFHNGNGNGPAKKAGEQTDYGDYNILVLEHLAATADSPHPMSLDEFIPTWQKRMSTWRAWMCTQTKQTMQQVQQRVPHNQLGGNSNAMALRHAAAFGYYDTEQGVVDAARTSMFTHRERTAQAGGEFFARVTFRVIHNGLTPKQAIEEVAAESNGARAFERSFLARVSASLSTEFGHFLSVPSPISGELSVIFRFAKMVGRSDKFIQDKVKQALDKVAEATDPTKDLYKEKFADDKVGRWWL